MSTTAESSGGQPGPGVATLADIEKDRNFNADFRSIAG